MGQVESTAVELFRDVAQKSAVCRALCRDEKGAFWTSQGVSSVLDARIEAVLRGEQQSAREHALIVLAYNFWLTGDIQVKLASLKADDVEMVSELLQAFTFGAPATHLEIDSWLKSYGWPW